MAYGEDFSPFEIAARRNPLETSTAWLLGQMVIAWSRVDLAVQLYVASLPAGSGADESGAATFDARLARLLDFAGTLGDDTLRSQFVEWIGQAREVAVFALSVRHGRWLPDPRRGVVLLLGEAKYTTGELEKALASQQRLLLGLHRLCAAERDITLSKAAVFLATQPIDVVEER